MYRLLFVVSVLALPLAAAFVLPTSARHHHPTVSLLAKKKASSGQGFGQTPVEKKKTSSPSGDSSSSSPLQSVETGASDAIPTMEAAPKQVVKTDPNMPAEERAKQVLREQYGLKTLEEQQTDARKREQMAAARQQREQWKQAAEQEEFDLIAFIPGPVQIFIDRFLKIGVAICTVLFIAAGIGITAEAWSKASGNPLPDDIDAFIVNTVEPNFTPGLLVLLGFSVSLGAFASLQLGSAGAQYKEDK